MNTIERGDLSVAILTATFLRLGFRVLKPLTERSRYDLVIERGRGFERVQCKTGRLRSGVIIFSSCSSLEHRGKAARHYRGEIELFGVYCVETDECYLVPVDEVGKRLGSLRVDRPTNNQQAKIRYADQFLLRAVTHTASTTLL
jgi:hypothetical protein